MITIRVDVSEQKQVELALAEQMSIQLALLENLPALVAHKDTDGRFVSVNRAYEDAFGVRREEIVGKNTSELEEFPSAQRLRGYEQDMEVLRTGRVLRAAEQVEFADGKMHDVLLWRIPDLSGGWQGGRT